MDSAAFWRGIFRYVTKTRRATSKASAGWIPAGLPDIPE